MSSEPERPSAGKALSIESASESVAAVLIRLTSTTLSTSTSCSRCRCRLASRSQNKGSSARAWASVSAMCDGDFGPGSASRSDTVVDHRTQPSADRRSSTSLCELK